MVSLRLFIEYGAYPVWMYDEDDGGVIDTAVPDEWQDDSELCSMLDSIQDTYDSLFVNNEKEFSFIGFTDIGEAEVFISRVKEAVDYIFRKNNGKYLLENRIDDEFFNGLYVSQEE